MPEESPFNGPGYTPDPKIFVTTLWTMVLTAASKDSSTEGEEALTEAILTVRRRGGIVAVVAHRPKSIEGADYVLVIAEGRVQSFGPREEILSKVLRTPVQLRVAAENQGGGRWTAR